MTALEFESAGAFGEWLAANHASASEVWVRLFKVHTGRASITWDEGVRVALAWGWIDAVKRSEGAESWVQRFTPRTARSRWSARNRDLAEALIAEGRMQPPGLAEVARAQADGRWQQAYAGAKGMEVPADFLAALAAAPGPARQTYAGLNRQNLYAICYRLSTAAKPETRARRIAALIVTLARGETFH